MNLFTKVTALASASALVLSLAACGGSGSTPAPDTTTPAEGAAYTVGICQQMTHEALDAATQGFMDALNELLPNQVEFLKQDAGGEYANCGTIMDGFVASDVDLILANATYPLQAAASATADIPVLGTSVTDYATALSIDGWTGTVGSNISGTSDLAPLDQILHLAQPGYQEAERISGSRSLELLLAPFDQESGQGGVMVVIHDVTTQRRNEEMRREFVANVSHELRTPLTNIRSYAETLVDGAGDIPPAMEKNFLGVILNESDRMTHIVQDLLTLSRFDSGRSELKLERFSFSAAVRDIYNAVLMEAQRHGHALTLDIGPDIPEMVGDRDRVLQVMMNVVSNAIKYTPDGGQIAIAAGRNPLRVWMEVSDNGIGIPEADRPRIFERFYRVDKARSRESGGTGLGLSIAKEIVDRHEGILALVDRPGPGTTIRIELPIEGPAHGK